MLLSSVLLLLWAGMGKSQQFVEVDLIMDQNHHITAERTHTVSLNHTLPTTNTIMATAHPEIGLKEIEMDVLMDHNGHLLTMSAQTVMAGNGTVLVGQGPRVISQIGTETHVDAILIEKDSIGNLYEVAVDALVDSNTHIQTLNAQTLAVNHPDITHEPVTHYPTNSEVVVTVYNTVTSTSTVVVHRKTPTRKPIFNHQPDQNYPEIATLTEYISQDLSLIQATSSKVRHKHRTKHLDSFEVTTQIYEYLNHETPTSSGPRKISGKRDKKHAAQSNYYSIKNRKKEGSCIDEETIILSPEQYLPKQVRKHHQKKEAKEKISKANKINNAGSCCQNVYAQTLTKIATHLSIVPVPQVQYVRVTNTVMVPTVKVLTEVLYTPYPVTATATETVYMMKMTTVTKGGHAGCGMSGCELDGNGMVIPAGQLPPGIFATPVQKVDRSKYDIVGYAGNNPRK